jgi:hypothetical protein
LLKQTRNEQGSDLSPLEWIYCNRTATGTVQFGTRRTQRMPDVGKIAGKTTELPDMPVRNELGDMELTRRGPLVRIQHRPLKKSGILQVKRRTRERAGIRFQALLL